MCVCACVHMYVGVCVSVSVSVCSTCVCSSVCMLGLLIRVLALSQAGTELHACPLYCSHILWTNVYNPLIVTLNSMEQSLVIL